jgi:hypothetical protein
MPLLPLGAGVSCVGHLELMWARVAAIREEVINQLSGMHNHEDADDLLRV